MSQKGLPGEGPGDPLRSLPPPRFSKRSMYRGLPQPGLGCAGLAYGLLALVLPGWAPCPLNTLLFSRTSLWGLGRAAWGPQGAVTVRPQHSCER